MDSSSTQTTQSRGATRDVWLVRIISLLLVVQALAHLLYCLYEWLQFDWQQELNVALSVEAEEALIIFSAFVPILIALLLVALGFLYRRRVAWMAAMTLQGLILLACLTFYFLEGENLFLEKGNEWLYPSMLYAILMVFYINARDTRLIFQRSRLKPYVRPITPPRYRGIPSDNTQ